MSDGDTFYEPVTLEEAKLNLRLDTDADDGRVSALIRVAREHVENYTGLVLVQRTVTETAARLGAWIELASWPVVEVSAIRYQGADGNPATITDGGFRLSASRRPARVLPPVTGWGVVPVSFDRYGGERRRAVLPVEIDVVAGYASSYDVPEAIKQAMHLLIAHFYANRAAAEVGARAAAVEIPFGVAVLLASARNELG